MIPLVPTVALALLSLTCSAFVIFRTMLSILPPRNLSRRLHPLHFSHPSSRPLPPADKSYIWLALCDISALGVFIWEAFAQWPSSPSSAPHDRSTIPGISTTSRLWLALTLRQTCFLVVSALILIHVRLRKSVSFGVAHWFLWVPLVFLATVSTVVAGVFAATTTYPGRIFRVGYITYSSAIAVLNTMMFGCLVGTLIIIRRSIEKFQRTQGSLSSNGGVEKPQAALAAEDIDAIREGSSWIASTTSSRQDASTISPFSYSTTRTRRTSRSATTSPERLRFPLWSPPGSYVYSSLPQTPSPRRDDAPFRDFEPFRRRAQSLRAAALSLSSRNSWITSSHSTHPTLSAWSFPTTLSSHHLHRTEESVASAIGSAPTQEGNPACIRFPTAAVPGGTRALDDQAEKGQPSPPGDAPSPHVIEISVLRILAWLAGVWVPLLFALPYIIHLNESNLQGGESASILLVISVTISSPILALNLLLRHPIPIRCGIFDAPRDPHPVARYYAPSMGSPFSDRHKWSSGMKQVTGPSATDGKSQLKRLLGVLGPAPKLSLLLPSNDTTKTSGPPQQPSARNRPRADAEVHASAEDEDVPRVQVQVQPPPRSLRAQTLPQGRHSFHQYQHQHHHPRYSQSHRHAYDRSRDRETRQTKSLSLSFPRDPGHDLF